MNLTDQSERNRAVRLNHQSLRQIASSQFLVLFGLDQQLVADNQSIGALASQPDQYENEQDLVAGSQPVLGDSHRSSRTCVFARAKLIERRLIRALPALVVPFPAGTNTADACRIHRSVPRRRDRRTASRSRSCTGCTAGDPPVDACHLPLDRPMSITRVMVAALLGLRESTRGTERYEEHRRLVEVEWWFLWPCSVSTSSGFERMLFNVIDGDQGTVSLGACGYLRPNGNSEPNPIRAAGLDCAWSYRIWKLIEPAGSTSRPGDSWRQTLEA